MIRFRSCVVPGGKDLRYVIRALRIVSHVVHVGQDDVNAEAMKFKTTRSCSEQLLSVSRLGNRCRCNLAGLYFRPIKKVAAKYAHHIKRKYVLKIIIKKTHPRCLLGMKAIPTFRETPR